MTECQQGKKRGSSQAALACIVLCIDHHMLVQAIHRGSRNSLIAAGHSAC